jgi:competence protein ComEC
VALLYAAGILGARLIATPHVLVLSLSLSLAAVCLIFHRLRPWLLPLLIFATGWTGQTLATAVLYPNDLRNLLGSSPELIAVQGTLSETPSLRVLEQDEKTIWHTMARLDVQSLRINHQNPVPARGRLAITTPGALTNLFAGQKVEVFGTVSLPKTAVAEGLFDYRAFLKEQGIYYRLLTESQRDWKIIGSPARPPLADRFRAWGQKALALGLHEEDESLRLQWALTLGWKTALTEETSEPFVQAATYHIFAVDGLRMAIIFGIFFGLLRAAGLPRPFCGVLLVPLLWFYVALTGWPASAIRACVMLSVVIFGWALGKPSDLINSLFAAAIIILVWQPQQLFQAGFQLSFFVVLCLILTIDPLRRLANRVIAPDPLLPPSLLPPWRRWLHGPLHYTTDLTITSFAAWIGSLPLVAYYFHIITPVSTPANIIAVPLCALTLMSNLGSLLLAGWFPAAAELFNHAGWFFMEIIRLSSQWFANWPAAYYYISTPSLLTTFTYYALLLAVLTGWIWRPVGRPWKICALAVPVVAWFACYVQASRTSTLTVLPLSAAYAVYFDAPRHDDRLLIDCGNPQAVQFTTIPFLRAQGVDRLATFLIAHGIAPQMGGAPLVLDSLNPEQLCVGVLKSRSSVFNQALQHVSRTHTKLRNVGNHDTLGSWHVLHPDPDDHFSLADDKAVVLLADIHGTRVLLLSNLGLAGQSALLQRNPDLRADIVLAGLPGKSQALCDELAAAIRPRLVIICDPSVRPQPASATLRDRLAQNQITVLQLASAGAVTIEFRRNLCSVRTINGLTWRSDQPLPPASNLTVYPTPPDENGTEKSPETP